MEEYLKDISDGKLYSSNDMVKVGCHDCNGCSACCCDMGESILLDPMDVWRLERNLGQSFEQLLAGAIDLHVEDGLILPNLKMAPSATGPKCSFLNEEGRCSIHPIRPGFCRLFPLGRYYQDGGFQYFLQIHECKKTNRSKIKVKKWIDTPDLKQYEKFVADWHYFLLDVQKVLYDAQDSDLIRNLNLYVVNSFYQKPYDPQMDFYSQFYQRLEKGRELLKLADD